MVNVGFQLAIHRAHPGANAWRDGNATLTVVEIGLRLLDDAVGSWVQLVDRLTDRVGNPHCAFADSDAPIITSSSGHFDFGDVLSFGSTRPSARHLSSTANRNQIP